MDLPALHYLLRTTMANFQDLGMDLILLILSLCDILTALRVSQANKFLHALVGEKSLWIHLVGNLVARGLLSMHPTHSSDLSKHSVATLRDTVKRAIRGPATWSTACEDPKALSKQRLRLDRDIEGAHLLPGGRFLCGMLRKGRASIGVACWDLASTSPAPVWYWRCPSPSEGWIEAAFDVPDPSGETNAVLLVEDDRGEVCIEVYRVFFHANGLPDEQSFRFVLPEHYGIVANSCLTIRGDLLACILSYAGGGYDYVEFIILLVNWRIGSALGINPRGGTPMPIALMPDGPLFFISVTDGDEDWTGSGDLLDLNMLRLDEIDWHSDPAAALAHADRLKFQHLKETNQCQYLTVPGSSDAGVGPSSRLQIFEPLASTGALRLQVTMFLGGQPAQVIKSAEFSVNVVGGAQPLPSMKHVGTVIRHVPAAFCVPGDDTSRFRRVSRSGHVLVRAAERGAAMSGVVCIEGAGDELEVQVLSETGGSALATSLSVGDALLEVDGREVIVTYFA